MKKFLAASLILAATAFSPALLAQADKAHADEERKEDVARHRSLAALHEAAARCLESGKPEKACQEQLRKDCKGIGIGKYCGMRHKH